MDVVFEGSFFPVSNLTCYNAAFKKNIYTMQMKSREPVKIEQKISTC
jgi:hypothetical protein